VLSLWAGPAAGQSATNSSLPPPQKKHELSLVDAMPVVVSQLRRMKEYFGSPWQRTGDIWERSALLGDPGGVRSEMVENGIFVDVGMTNVYQGNAIGGRDVNDSFKYQGSLDYFVTLDTGRLNLWPGGLLVAHGETMISRGANRKVGSLMPANMDAVMPWPDDPGLTTLSEAYVVQGLAEGLVMFLGKVDAAGLADTNRFANSERTQFMNLGLVNNALLLPFAPYTSLTAALGYTAGGFEILAGAVDGNGDAKTSGADTAFTVPSGTTYASQVSYNYEIDGLPGTALAGGLYSDKNFVNFAQDRRTLIRNLLLGLPPNTVEDAYAFFANFSQFLHVEDKASERGWGIFGRVGWGPPDRNAIDQFYSFGIGGKGVGERHQDRFGVGFYYAHLSHDLRRLVNNLNVGETGLELFYNYALTPAIEITPDVQFIFNPSGGLKNNFNDNDFALVLGIRAQINF
jgi:porin